MILHFVTAFLLQEINASQEKSQRKSNSPSQTGKVPGPNTDAGRIGLIIHWALKSKKVPTSEARLYGFELDLALEGKVSAEPTDELYFGQTLVWLYGFLHSLPQIFIVSLSHFPT